MADSDDFATRIAAAYASDGPTLELGRAMLGGTTFPEAVVHLPAAKSREGRSMMNTVARGVFGLLKKRR